MHDLSIEIRVARIRAGMTQRELGKALNRDQSSISRYETDKGVPDLETLEQIAKVTNCEEIKNFVA